MVERDYIKRMINALSKVVAKMMGLTPPEGLDIIKGAYQDYLKIEDDWLDSLTEVDLLATLLNEKQLNVHQIEFLAELMAKEGELLLEMKSNYLAFTKFKKALILFNYVDAESDEFSFERRALIVKINDTLKTSMP